MRAGAIGVFGAPGGAVAVHAALRAGAVLVVDAAFRRAAAAGLDLAGLGAGAVVVFGAGILTGAVDAWTAIETAVGPRARARFDAFLRAWIAVERAGAIGGVAAAVFAAAVDAGARRQAVLVAEAHLGLDAAIALAALPARAAARVAGVGPRAFIRRGVGHGRGRGVDRGVVVHVRRHVRRWRAVAVIAGR